jgi:hypothetical protein
MVVVPSYIGLAVTELLGLYEQFGVYGELD